MGQTFVVVRPLHNGIPICAEEVITFTVVNTDLQIMDLPTTDPLAPSEQEPGLVLAQNDDDDSGLAGPGGPGSDLDQTQSMNEDDDLRLLHFVVEPPDLDAGLLTFAALALGGEPAQVELLRFSYRQGISSGRGTSGADGRSGGRRPRRPAPGSHDDETQGAPQSSRDGDSAADGERHPAQAPVDARESAGQPGRNSLQCLWPCICLRR